MIPLLCNLAASGEGFKIDRGMTGYYSHDLDMSELTDDKKDLSFSGFSVEVGGVKHYIAKENRGAGFGDVVHLRKKNNALLATTFEIKAAQDESQKSHVSAVRPWMNSLLTLGKNSDEIHVSKLRDMNIVYSQTADKSVSDTKFNADGSARKIRNSDTGSSMKRHSRYSKRRIGIPTSGLARATDWSNGEPTKYGSSPQVNMGTVLELQSSEGRGFASF
jgi:hypothetical protein